MAREGRPASRGRCHCGGCLSSSAIICLALAKLILRKAADASCDLLTRRAREDALIPSVKKSRETLKAAEKPHASSVRVYAASEDVSVKASASTMHPGGRVLSLIHI